MRRYRARALIVALLAWKTNATPIALHQLIEVAIGGEVVLNLSGYNSGSDDTTATINSLPESGTLHQLSYIFKVQGHDPKAGQPILSVPFTVNGTKSRVVYKRPILDRDYYKEWGRFSYCVADKHGRSLDGTIVLVPPSAVVASSDFWISDDGWTTVGNRPNGVQHEFSSRAMISHYIYATENSINVNQEKEDIDVWYFSLPKKFLGWNGILYGGRLEFTISSFGGDFIRLLRKNIEVMHLVEISCAKCNIGNGIKIGYPIKLGQSFNGTTAYFSITLSESSGWLKDPKNTHLAWTSPSKCEIIQVLSGISSITILGDYTSWYESVCIDDVRLVAAKPVGRRQLPSCAQTTPDARKCTCN